MDPILLPSLAERLRVQAIGAPKWLQEKHVYEFEDNSAKVVAVLKLIRAVHGIESMKILCGEGRFIDLFALARCVLDCISEIYFLLEHYPSESDKVRQFVKRFFEITIDNHSTSETHAVSSKVIRSAVVRTLSGNSQDEKIRKNLLDLYSAYSGYIHADYPHVMEMYGGPARNFNLSGIPSPVQKQRRMAAVEALEMSVLFVLAFLARSLGMTELHQEAIDAAS